MKKLRVLIACEESQAVCLKIHERGHFVRSADILDCSGPRPDLHIKGDVLKILDSYEGKKWDLMIAFPPCTHLAVSGARHFAKKREDGRQQQGIDFFMKMWQADIPRIAVENPIGIMNTHPLMRGSRPQIVHPWWFGDPFSKATCLWLKGLSPLQKKYKLVDKEYESETGVVSLFDGMKIGTIDRGEFVTFSSGKRMPKWYNDAAGNGHLRSKTFNGIAKAMAETWTPDLSTN